VIGRDGIDGRDGLDSYVGRDGRGGVDGGAGADGDHGGTRLCSREERDSPRVWWHTESGQIVGTM